MGSLDERGTLSPCDPLPNTMAKVDWSTGIDSVSGALSKPSKSGQHSCTKMLLGTHRTAPTTSSNCNRLFIRKKVKRTTPVTADELAQRQRFAAVSRAVNERAHNMSQYPQDYAAWKAQLNTPGAKTTFKAYLWQLLGAVYDENQG